MSHRRSRPRRWARLWSGLLVWILILAAPWTPGRPAWAEPPTTPPTPIRARLNWRDALAQTSQPPAPPASTAAAVRNLAVVADATVRQGQAAQNFGIFDYLGAGYDADAGWQAYRSLLDFGVTDLLPPGTTIQSATLQVQLAGFCNYSGDPAISVQAYRLTAAWSEMSVTWNNQPAFAEGYGAVAIPQPSLPFNSPIPYTLDVTALVQAWVNGTYPEFGLVLRGPESWPYGCASRDFLSRAGSFQYAPVLQVTYSLPTPALTASADLTFFHQCGAAAPAAQTLALTSNSATLAAWTASAVGGPSWLNLSATAGQVSWLFPDAVQVSVTEAAPCPGTVSAEVQVSAAGLGGTATVDVTLIQSDEAVSVVYLPLLARSTAISASAAVTAAAGANRYALVVGVADYQHLDPPTVFSPFRTGAWDDGTDLFYSGPDAVPAARHFSASGYDTTVLRDEHATKANLVYWLQRVDQQIDQLARPSVGALAVTPAEVVLYFSGHGGPFSPDQAPLDEADNDDEFLAPFDTSAAPFANYLLDDELKTYLANLGGVHVAVILDACNSGGMDVSQANHVLLAAAQENESSWEASELEHGVFTYHLLLAVQDPASDTNQDGWLSLGEIQAFAQPRIAQYLTDKGLTLQHTVLVPNGVGDLNVVQLP